MEDGLNRAIDGFGGARDISADTFGRLAGCERRGGEQHDQDKARADHRTLRFGFICIVGRICLVKRRLDAPGPFAPIVRELLLLPKSTILQPSRVVKNRQSRAEHFA